MACAVEADARVETPVIIEQNTKTPGPATIVTEQGVFLYVPTGPGYGVIVPLEGSQTPSRAYSGGEPTGTPQAWPDSDRSSLEAESALESLSEESDSE